MNTEGEHVEKELAEDQEILLKLDRYEDIFSDFDLRPYSRRTLSVDFLDELRRASYEKESGAIEVVLHMPTGKRNEASEGKIKERLKDHFKKHYTLLLSQKARVVRRGATMVVMGVIAMLLASFIHFKYNESNLMVSFLVILLEPAAWFLLWEGMDLIIFGSKDINAPLAFYKKMSQKRNSIIFKGY